MSDFMPVEIVTPDNTSHATAGVKNAPKPAENPKPLADKVGDPKPVKELAPKAVSYTHLDVYKRQIVPNGTAPSVVAIGELLPNKYSRGSEE